MCCGVGLNQRPKSATEREREREDNLSKNHYAHNLRQYQRERERELKRKFFLLINCNLHLGNFDSVLKVLKFISIPLTLYIICI